MSVNMFRLPVRSEAAPRVSSGQPAHSTAGVASTSSTQPSTGPPSQVLNGAPGSMSPIASTKVGTARAVATMQRRVMPLSSPSSASLWASTVTGSSAMPQMGHARQGPAGGTRRRCIGQV